MSFTCNRILTRVIDQETASSGQVRVDQLRKRHITADARYAFTFSGVAAGKLAFRRHDVVTVLFCVLG